MKMVIVAISLFLLSLSSLSSLPNLWANELSDGEKEYKAGNFKKAQELFSSACDNKEKDACDRLGELYRDRRFVRQHKAEAVAWLERSCNRNDKLEKDPAYGFLTEKNKNDLLVNNWLFISEVAGSAGVKLFGGLFLETEAGFQFTTKLQGHEAYMHRTFIGVNIGGYIRS